MGTICINTLGYQQYGLQIHMQISEFALTMSDGVGISELVVPDIITYSFITTSNEQTLGNKNMITGQRGGI